MSNDDFIRVGDFIINRHQISHVQLDNSPYGTFLNIVTINGKTIQAEHNLGMGVDVYEIFEKIKP